MDLRSERMLSTMRTTQNTISVLLTESRNKTESLCILLVSVNPNSGRATIIASDNEHSELESHRIVFPPHMLLMLPLTPMSAPLPVRDFTLPQSLEHFREHYVVVATVRDMQNEMLGVVLTFVKSSNLNAHQHTYMDILRQKVELNYLSELARHPYSDKLSEQLSLLEEVSAISKVGAWQIDRFTGAFSSTQIMRSLLGLLHSKSISLQDVLEVISFEDRVALKQRIFKAIKKHSHFAKHITITDKQGRTKNIKLTVFLQVECQPSLGLKLTRLYGVVQDETETQRLSDSQQNYTDYLTSILNGVDSIVLSIDKSGTILSANEPVASVLGFQPEELIGQDIKLLATKVQNRGETSYLLNLGEGVERCSEIKTINECLRHKNGKRIACDVSLRACKVHNQELVIASIRSVSNLHFEVDRFRQLALTDPLTGLSNLYHFEQYLLEKAALASSEKALSVFMQVSIVNVKEYEDAFGEPTVDYILRILASRFVRAFDVSKQLNVRVFIYDRGNFILHLENYFKDDHTAKNAAQQCAHYLRDNVLVPITLHNSSLAIETKTVSCAIPPKYFSFKKIKELMSRKVINEGIAYLDEEREHAYSHINGSDIDRYNYIKHSLNRAIANNELFIELQPQYCGNGNLISSEVLLRWHHPHLGVVMPAEFIPIAEQNDFIADIGLWVCNEACKLLSECHTKSIDTKLSINISAKHLARADFVSKFVAIVNRWRVAHKCLKLELTEGAVIKGVNIIQRRVRDLAQQGFSLSIDDFGIGDSNLSSLQTLPINELKVDKVFIEAIENSKEKNVLVTNICNMAKALKLVTVAEGIETTGQLNEAKACGCSAFQGYYLDKPMSVDAWREKVVQAQNQL
ncbi:phosphodiesterase [Alteromonas sp. BL110]|uniref:GGDEF domain-containing phosphodiesterase n=1 Tax=Alteromonas sp. BL110 TaxID=1714845 RepID=UPI000E4FD951|nr:GGDEF domain-containing phosphodiesterase [Alteromonas sp. BL110]AXT37350.1 phosphodiesterase [Alteromonas sp. BL110]RKM80088.1 EAL domain-containing protein [Alteromonas sp. BL110]